MHNIMRLSAVIERTGLSRSTIYLRISKGCFPRSISLGGRAVGWIDTEVNEWVVQQIKASCKAERRSGRAA
jgi:prophage regulatory protein